MDKSHDYRDYRERLAAALEQAGYRKRPSFIEDEGDLPPRDPESEHNHSSGPRWAVFTGLSKAGSGYHALRCKRRGCPATMIFPCRGSGCHLCT